MKILIVSKVPTHPVRMGNSRLITDQATLLRAMGHEVHFLYIHEVRRQERSKFISVDSFKEMTEFWGDKFHLLKIGKLRHLFMITRNFLKYKFNKGYIHPDDNYTSSIHREINILDKLENFDCCIVNYFYLTKALTRINIPRKAFLTHDIYTFRDIICGYKVKASLTPNHEAMSAQRAEYILNVQEEDSTFFKKLSPKSTILTTFTSFDHTPTPYVGNHNILFLSGSSEFNINGIDWFIKNVLPKVVATYPDTKLIIGGGICNHLRNHADNPNIQLLGFVDNEADFFNLGDIFINPTYQGTGLKIKTFEGIAKDKVVIAHPHSTIGIYDPYKAPIYSSASPEEWAYRIIEIFNDKASVMKIKDEDKEYIDNMRDFIKSQYEILLS